MVKRLRRPRTRAVQTDTAAGELARAAERGRRLVEESREIVVVLDGDHRVLAASRRARESIDGLEEGSLLREDLLRGDAGRMPFEVTYDVEGRRETLVYLRETGDLAAYEELRAGFTAAVSHELRTPLARILALLETAELPGANAGELIEQARAEVAQIGALIDDVLFLSELDTGREIVGLTPVRAYPIVEEALDRLGEGASRAGVTLAVAGDETVELPLRARMLRVVASNLAENAIRYAGPGATFTATLGREGGTVFLAGSDDGVGVSEDDLPRLFERFYRADRARASRGTGLGLAIVKHIVSSAGGTVEATGARGDGLTIRCVFTTP